jgi:shikimate dehydrogenase
MSLPFKMAGVMGWPVAHSRSPIIHNYWLSKYELKGAYGLFPVQPGNLDAAIKGMLALGIVGSNVTIPHKVEAMKLMDHVDPLAKRMGAINTIVITPEGQLQGFNNDGFGYIQSLKDANAQWRADAGPIAVLGAGGASRAIVLSLLDQGAKEIRLMNRTQSKAQDLADEFSNDGPYKGAIKVLPWAERQEALESVSLLVNTTNQGMHGQEPLSIDLSHLPAQAMVSDAIYIPLETPLLKAARERGHITVNGLGMLLNQARPAFKAWFGVLPEITPELRQLIVATL